MTPGSRPSSPISPASLNFPKYFISLKFSQFFNYLLILKFRCQKTLSESNFEWFLKSALGFLARRIEAIAFQSKFTLVPHPWILSLSSSDSCLLLSSLPYVLLSGHSQHFVLVWREAIWQRVSVAHGLIGPSLKTRSKREVWEVTTDQRFP